MKKKAKALSLNTLSSEAQQPGADRERARSDRPSRTRRYGDRGSEDVSRELPGLRSRSRSTYLGTVPKASKARLGEVKDYDERDVSNDIGKQIKFEDLGLELPQAPPTQVVSIRLPTALLNEIKAICSEQDIPYQGWIKWCMSEAVRRAKAA